MRICKKCQQSKALSEFVKDKRCEGGRRYTCNACKNLGNHESYLRHREKRIKNAQDWYWENRDRRLKYAKAWYEDNKDRHKVYAVKYRSKLRDEVFKAYGGKCVCCGEKEPMFLTIDHINGNGNKHRAEILGSFNRAGMATYKWLRQQGYPKEFQVLCQNCNVGKHRNNGICPHKARLKR